VQHHVKMSKRPAQNGDHGPWEANGEAPAQKVKVDPAQDGQDKPSDEVRPNISSGMFRSCGTATHTKGMYCELIRKT
jgi:hypothetical protein